MYNKWVHLTCIFLNISADNRRQCVWCKEPIAEGETTKRVNIGGQFQVAHTTCSGRGVESSNYVLELFSDDEDDTPSPSRSYLSERFADESLPSSQDSHFASDLEMEADESETGMTSSSSSSATPGSKRRRR
jgi:hypothetical protein